MSEVKRVPQLRIGISGWTYVPWRGTFYPSDLPQKKELWYASRQLNSIELNGSFYSLQTPGSYQAWYQATPGDFIFSIKGGRFITHMRRLKNVENALANFFASGVLALGEKLGPFLWQLPPNLKFDPEVIESFFKLLPRTTTQAAELARQHDSRLKARAFCRTDVDRPLRHCMEVRHVSFQTPAFLELLRKYQVAIVIADTAGKWPLIEEITADFVYLRLHGDEELYVSGYTDAALSSWAGKIRAWQKAAPLAAASARAKPRPAGANLDVYVYFDNDVKVRAPFDAMRLSTMLTDRGERHCAPDIDFSAVSESPRRSWPAIRPKPRRTNSLKPKSGRTGSTKPVVRKSRVRKSQA
jgi:uncharacterized protein YecE (DUF72 family)